MTTAYKEIDLLAIELEIRVKKIVLEVIELIKINWTTDIAKSWKPSDIGKPVYLWYLWGELSQRRLTNNITELAKTFVENTPSESDEEIVQQIFDITIHGLYEQTHLPLNNMH